MNFIVGRISSSNSHADGHRTLSVFTTQGMTIF
jgi:hypothetical protein